MFNNPFKTKVNPSVMAFNPAATVPDDPDTSNDYYPPTESGGVRGGTVQLNDAYIPGTEPNIFRGNVGDIVQGYRPAYAGSDDRVIVTTAGVLPTYDFLSPAPGSTDLAIARDSNSVPGTANNLNYMHGPVSGWAMDSYQAGNRQVLATTPPGARGPVVGGQDYGSIVSNATFQQAFAAYSTAPSDQTIVSSI